MMEVLEDPAKIGRPGYEFEMLFPDRSRDPGEVRAEFRSELRRALVL